MVEVSQRRVLTGVRLGVVWLGFVLFGGSTLVIALLLAGELEPGVELPAWLLWVVLGVSAFNLVMLVSRLRGWQRRDASLPSDEQEELWTYTSEGCELVVAAGELSGAYRVESVQRTRGARTFGLATTDEDDGAEYWLTFRKETGRAILHGPADAGDEAVEADVERVMRLDRAG